MKTTLELPDALFQRVKRRAVHRRRKLKDEVAALLEAGLAHAPAADPIARPGDRRSLNNRAPSVRISAARR